MLKRFPDILRDLFDVLAQNGSRLTDFNPGSVIRTILEAVAAVVEDCYFLLDNLIDKFYTGTSEGEWLDRRVNDFGLCRKPGSAAAGVIVVGRDSPSPIGILIPAGTKWVTDNGLEFVSAADAAINVGQTTVEVNAKANVAGRAGNLMQGTLLKQAGIAITGIEWGRIKQMGGGIDEESDEELKARVVPYFKSIGRSTRSAISFAALSVAGVKSVTLMENQPAPGWFKVYIDDGSGTASPELCAAVAERVEEYRGFTVRYQVLAPRSKPVDITAVVTAKNEYNPAQVKADVHTALINYVNSLGMGQQVYIAGMYKISMSVNGVENIHITAPLEEIAVAGDEIAKTDEKRVVIR